MSSAFWVPNSNHKIYVLLVDREAIFRAGLRQILSEEGDIEVIAECELSKDVIELIEASICNVALVDIDLPSLGGIDLARQISRRSPSTRVIVMSATPDEEQLFQAIKVGAGAYLGKAVSPKELTETIRNVNNGDYPINDSVLKKPSVAERVLRQFQDLSLLAEGMENVAIPLTSREMEILNHISTGHSNKQVAGMLHLSEQTVKNHVTSILRKLNANDRTHAVVLAMRHGWIALEERERIPTA